jgi:hypothetical protein
MEYEIEAEFIHEFTGTALKVLPTQLLVQETMLTYCTMKITNNVNPVI